MNVNDTYVEADSTNLPKVDTLMLFGFLMNGRKFSCAELENDKENSVSNKYGDDSIGYVLVLRNPNFCVVKASITADKDSAIAVRALIHETKHAVFKLECKNCYPADCIHGFALLLWLHRRSEESTNEVVNYYREPGSMFNKMSKQDVTDLLLTPKSSNSPLQNNSYLNNYCSPETKQFLHGCGIYSQTTTQSSQNSQTAYHLNQRTSERHSQDSNSNSECSQNNNFEITNQDDFKSENAVFVEPLCKKNDRYSTPLSQTVHQITHHTPQKEPQESILHSQSLHIRNLELATRDNGKNENSTLIQPLTQIDAYSTQLSQTTYQTTQYTPKKTSQKSYLHSHSHLLQMRNLGMVTHNDRQTENSAYSQPSASQSTMPLSQITNAENISSPKQPSSSKKSPYSQNKSSKAISPKTLKKQSMLSKKVSQLVKQPKIDNFFVKPKPDLEDISKPQVKNLFMSQLVKNFLKLNKGTVEDFMSFAGKQMTEFLCQEAEKLTRVQRTDLWMDLRYGRITASIINEAANCHTVNGSLVNKILGKVSKYQSPAMKRGIELEEKILRQVQLQENLTTSSSGLFLVPSCPIIGASPDAIGKDFIVEIKAPSSDTSFHNFLSNGNVSKKCKSQMYLQMYCTGMKRGIFCVADPNFESNNKVTTVWLDYDEEFNEILEKAKMFWISAIFPRLVNL